MAKTKETTKKAVIPKKTTKAKSKKAAVKKPKTTAKKMSEKERFCSFCNKSSLKAYRLIAAPNNIFICDECIDVCNRILLEESKDIWRNRLLDILTQEANKEPVKKIKSKPSQEQIDKIIDKYSKMNVLSFLLTTPTNTLINFTSALKYGLTAGIFSPYIKISELDTNKYFSATIKAHSEKLKIIETILKNIFNRYPNYFRKIGNNKYAINEIFILDFLFHNKDQFINNIDILSIYNYILDFENFTKVIETFYLPYQKEETKYTARIKFKELKPYKYSKKKQLIIEKSNEEN